MSCLATQVAPAFGVSKTSYDLGSSPSFNLSEGSQEAIRSLLVAPAGKPVSMKSRLAKCTGPYPEPTNDLNTDSDDEHRHARGPRGYPTSPGDDDGEDMVTGEAADEHPKAPFFPFFGHLRGLSPSFRSFKAGKRARRILFPEAHVARSSLAIN